MSAGIQFLGDAFVRHDVANELDTLDVGLAFHGFYKQAFLAKTGEEHQELGLPFGEDDDVIETDLGDDIKEASKNNGGYALKRGAPLGPKGSRVNSRRPAKQRNAVKTLAAADKGA